MVWFNVNPAELERETTWILAGVGLREDRRTVSWGWALQRADGDKRASLAGNERQLLSSPNAVAQTLRGNLCAATDEPLELRELPIRAGRWLLQRRFLIFGHASVPSDRGERPRRVYASQLAPLRG